jgi:hypothetical protein
MLTFGDKISDYLTVALNVCGEETLKLTVAGPKTIYLAYGLTADNTAVYSMADYIEVDTASFDECYRASRLFYGTNLIFYSDAALT